LSQISIALNFFTAPLLYRFPASLEKGDGVEV